MPDALHDHPIIRSIHNLNLPLAANMRATTRLLANVKYLTPGAPTGLTGVFTHSAPRSTLLFLYNSTLDKLQHFPEHSVYRQSVEALTKHRLAIVESVKPEGLESWQDRVRQIVDANPQAFRQVASISNPKEQNFVFKSNALEAMEKDKKPVQKAELEGPRTMAARSNQASFFQKDPTLESSESIPRIEPEPALSAEQ